MLLQQDDSPRAYTQLPPPDKTTVLMMQWLLVVAKAARKSAKRSFCVELDNGESAGGKASG